MKELEPFEQDLYSLIKNVKFRDFDNEHLNMLKADIQKVKKSNKVVVQADKTQNMYLMVKSKFEKVVIDNVTKNYTQSTHRSVIVSDNKSALIAKSLKLEDRMTKHRTKNCYVLVKDHKKKLQYRLTNPAISDIQKILKHILDKINCKLRSSTDLNQWRCTEAVLDWFNKLEDKSSLRFFKFDIYEFYPTITPNLLKKALKFASTLAKGPGGARSLSAGWQVSYQISKRKKFNGIKIIIFFLLMVSFNNCNFHYFVSSV